jgi:D-alanyl-D-alanine dipeptidase
MRWIAALCLVFGASITAAASSARVSRISHDPAVTSESVRATGYVRGRPRTIEVVPVDDVWLAKATARDFRAMQAAAAKVGIELSIRSGFRDHERQIWLYQAWRAGYGNRAARPGYSLHQSGRALDLRVRDPETRAWLKKHARRFGFQRTVSDEPWHFEHVGRPKRRSASR